MKNKLKIMIPSLMIILICASSKETYGMDIIECRKNSPKIQLQTFTGEAQLAELKHLRKNAFEANNQEGFEQARAICASLIMDKKINNDLKARAYLLLARMDLNGEGLIKDQPNYSHSAMNCDFAIKLKTSNETKAKAQFYRLQVEYHVDDPSYRLSRQLCKDIIDNPTAKPQQKALARLRLGIMEINGQGSQNNKPNYTEAKKLFNEIVDNPEGVQSGTVNDAKERLLSMNHKKEKRKVVNINSLSPTPGKPLIEVIAESNASKNSPASNVQSERDEIKKAIKDLKEKVELNMASQGFTPILEWKNTHSGSQNKRFYTTQITLVTYLENGKKTSLATVKGTGKTCDESQKKALEVLLKTKITEKKEKQKKKKTVSATTPLPITKILQIDLKKEEIADISSQKKEGDENTKTDHLSKPEVKSEEEQHIPPNTDEIYLFREVLESSLEEMNQQDHVPQNSQQNIGVDIKQLTEGLGQATQKEVTQLDTSNIFNVPNITKIFIKPTQNSVKSKRRLPKPEVKSVSTNSQQKKEMDTKKRTKRERQVDQKAAVPPRPSGDSMTRTLDSVKSKESIIKKVKKTAKIIKKEGVTKAALRIANPVIPRELSSPKIIEGRNPLDPYFMNWIPVPHYMPIPEGCSYQMTPTAILIPSTTGLFPLFDPVINTMGVLQENHFLKKQLEEKCQQMKKLEVYLSKKEMQRPKRSVSAPPQFLLTKKLKESKAIMSDQDKKRRERSVSL